MTKLSLMEFGAYTFFFGNIATGPIQIFQETTRQKTRQLVFSGSNITEAVLLIVLGNFKIFSIAGNLSQITAPLFTDQLNPNVDLFIPFLFNKYEIYANFSGYTDIAIGIGCMFGIHLPQNFNRPFYTRSIIEFWKRWHMSLSAWIRMYVFFPLITSRFRVLGIYPIMCVTFTIFALWHGAKLTYITYGFIQVFLIFLSYQFRKLNLDSNKFMQSKLIKIFQWLWFYIVLISIPGLMFRSPNLVHFGETLKQLSSSSIAGIFSLISSISLPLTYGLISICFIEIIDAIGFKKITKFVIARSYSVKILIIVFSLLMLLLLGNSNSGSSFIYSNF